MSKNGCYPSSDMCLHKDSLTAFNRCRSYRLETDENHWKHKTRYTNSWTKPRIKHTASWQITPQLMTPLKLCWMQVDKVSQWVLCQNHGRANQPGKVPTNSSSKMHRPNETFAVMFLQQKLACNMTQMQHGEMSLVRLRAIWITNHPPSVLWHCWLGHLTCKNIVSKMT